MRLLYKYCSLERAEQILRTHTIRISDATKLNDPFEYAYLLSNNFPSGLTDFDELSLKLKYIIPRLRQFGIYCLTEKNDSILMWAHYASQNEGVCIEFDVDRDKELFDRLELVKYQKNYPLIVKKGDLYDVIDVLTTKYIDWHYEKEVRLIKEGMMGKDLCLKPESIRSIILGCNISHFYTDGTTKNDREKLRTWKSLIRRLKEPQNRHIVVKQVQCEAKEYKIRIAEVPFLVLQNNSDEILIVSLKVQKLKVYESETLVLVCEYMVSKWQELKIYLPKGIYYLSNDVDNLFTLEIEHSPSINFCERLKIYCKRIFST